MRTSLALLVALLLGLSASRAAADDVPSNLQANFMLRILSFDRNLKTRMTGADVVYVVTFKAGDARSEAIRAEMVANLGQLAQTSNVVGLPIVVKDFPYDAGFEAKAAGVKAVAVYVCPGLEGELANITNLTRKRSWLSFAMTEPAVAVGIAIGLVVDSGRPTILVNLDASKAEGADLDAGLLRVAKLLKK